MRYTNSGNIFDSSFYFVDAILQGVANVFLGQNPRSLIDIESVSGDHTIVMRDGTLLSFIALDGAKSAVLGTELRSTLGRLERKFKGYIAEGDHYFSWYFSSDSDGVDKEIDRIYAESAKATLKRINMPEATELVEEQKSVLTKYCQTERNLLVVWTNTSGLTKEEISAVQELAIQQRKNVPIMNHAQTLGRGIEVYLNKHIGLVDELVSDLSECNILTRTISTHKQLFEIRKSLDSEWTDNLWEPILAGDKLSFTIPETKKFDYSSIGIPEVRKQVLPRKVSVPQSNYAQIGDTLYAPVTVEMPPREPAVFNNLFDRLRKDDIPFRIKFDISNNGLGVLGFKTMLASILTWTPGQEDNKLLLEVKKELDQLKHDGDEIIKFKIMLCTWAPADNKKLLDIRRSKIAKILTGWGQAEAAEVEGDVVESLFSSVPGLTLGNIAPPSAMPLYDAIKMSPITRPGSIWDVGCSPYRSIDGKLLPYMPYSSEQEAWISLFFGPMGSGKSVAMNSFNWSLIQHPDCDELPFISIIDIGPSSKGLISLLKQYLPKYQKHMAVYKRLKNRHEDCINVFDTPLGLRKPLSNHKSFLANFIAYILTPDGKETPPDGSLGIANSLIKYSYEYCYERKTAYLYKPNIEPQIDEKLEELDFQLNRKKVIWWDIVDFLYSKGETHLATVAQCQAVPSLSTLVQLCSDERVVSGLEDLKVNETSESITSYAARKLSDAIDQYPVIASRTKLDFGEARVISLDLDEVAKGKGAEAQRRTGLMYMVAYMVLTKRFYTGPEHLEEMDGEIGYLNVDYRPYHESLIQSIAKLPKRFCIDEKHRVKGQTIVEEQMDTAIVEGRKWRVEVAQASQLPDDFSDKSVELCTNIFILGVGSEQNKSKVVEKFKLDKTMQYHLSNTLRKPDKRGSTFLGLFSTASGWCNQILVDTKGPRFLWATNSSSNDRYVRSKIAEEVGDVVSRDILAKLFPGGSLDSEIERRQEQEGIKRAHAEFRVEDEILEEIEEEEVPKSILEAIAFDSLKQARAQRII